MSSTVTVATVKADMLLNMDKPSLQRTQNSIRNATRRLKKDLGEIGEGATKSIEGLTEASGGLGSVIGSAVAVLLGLVPLA